MNVQPTTEDIQVLLASEEHCRMKLEIIVLGRLLREQVAQIGELSKPKRKAKS